MWISICQPGSYLKWQVGQERGTRPQLCSTLASMSRAPLWASDTSNRRGSQGRSGTIALAGTCKCGNARHVPVVGKDKSKASAEYPYDLCRMYAELAIRHFKRMALAEVLSARLEVAQSEVEELRAKAKEIEKTTREIVDLTHMPEDSERHPNAEGTTSGRRARASTGC